MSDVVQEVDIVEFSFYTVVLEDCFRITLDAIVVLPNACVRCSRNLCSTLRFFGGEATCSVAVL